MQPTTVCSIEDFQQHRNSRGKCASTPYSRESSLFRNLITLTWKPVTHGMKMHLTSNMEMNSTDLIVNGMTLIAFWSWLIATLVFITSNIFHVAWISGRTQIHIFTLKKQKEKVTKNSLCSVHFVRYLYLTLNWQSHPACERPRFSSVVLDTSPSNFMIPFSSPLLSYSNGSFEFLHGTKYKTHIFNRSYSHSVIERQNLLS